MPSKRERPVFCTLGLVAILMGSALAAGAVQWIIMKSSEPSASVQLLTVSLPRETKVGQSLVIDGLVRDPANPNGPFGLPGAKVTVRITAPSADVETMSTLTSMSGTWEISYIPRSAGVYVVQVEVGSVGQITTAEFVAR